MNVGNANDLVEVSVCANGMQSEVDFDAFGGACGNIGGLPCPLTQSGVITAISVAGPGVSASITCPLPTPAKPSLTETSPVQRRQPIPKQPLPSNPHIASIAARNMRV